jgi:exportin-T
MSHLLVHFEPSELVDFMNFIGLLIYKLQVRYAHFFIYEQPNILVQKDLFTVLDELISPLSSHVMSFLSLPVAGTDDQVIHSDTKRAYLTLLNNIMSSKLSNILTSERKRFAYQQDA